MWLIKKITVFSHINITFSLAKWFEKRGNDWDESQISPQHSIRNNKLYTTCPYSSDISVTIQYPAGSQPGHRSSVSWWQSTQTTQSSILRAINMDNIVRYPEGSQHGLPSSESWWHSTRTTEFTILLAVNPNITVQIPDGSPVSWGQSTWKT